MARLAQQYAAWMGIKGYSEVTIRTSQRYLRAFFRWCEERGLTSPRQMTKPIFESFQRHLYHHTKTDGQPLSFRAQKTYLVAVKGFFRWLARANHILYDPAATIELPKVEERLPRYVLSAHEAEVILSQPDVSIPLGLRDRAMLETLYSTGIRRMELCKLDVYCVDTERGTLMVRQGKGKKDRVIPIGERAMAWIRKYLFDVRPVLVVQPDCGALFLSHSGDSLSPTALTDLVSRYVTSADIGKKGSCHLFRHSMATLMLENGADIRFVQVMLGHVNIETTQIYTHVAIRKLKEIHTRTHPAGQGRATRDAKTATETETEAKVEMDARTQSADLLALLDAEAGEEHE